MIPVNGCSYGKDTKPFKKRKDGSEYWKFCGQDFWSLISGKDNLFAEIIEPLGHEAKKHNDDFEKSYARVINRFTIKFAETYCTPQGDIDWEKIVRFVSERREEA
ncbi:MAG: hypothetical protein D6737_20205 [Chloroflexi bacterium]|nr:MAG: hypothetical protein CUN54_08480 [Phototrophicales bacterium]RMF76406.1 MAG: hypothetical protein D6737_20205 [Chloroflexota bacterium]